MMMLKRQYLGLILLVVMGLAQAADNAELRSKLEALMPDADIGNMESLDNTGLVEVTIDGSIVYFSADGRYLFQGDVTSLDTRENITETKRVALKKTILASLNEADMIVYEPKKIEHTLTVFTDIDCGYCRKLHQQMAAYNDLGIRIRYMAFPRSGIDSPSYDKAVDVWCSDDRQTAMTAAKEGRDIEVEICDSPVKAQYETGRKLGVTGTPALFLDSGELLPGYVPPKRLKQILDER